MDFISIDEKEYTKLKNESIKYEFLMNYLMSKLYYNYVSECVSFDYKLTDYLIDILKSLDKIFNEKIKIIEQEAEKDEDTN